MVFVYFLLAAAITVYAAIKLSTYADVMSTKSKMGGLIVGTVLLAGATSLPEVTTSVSAVLINNPDIAIGNVLGSNLFNIFILAMFDLYFRQKRLFNGADREHLYTAMLGIALTLVTMLSLILRINFTIIGIGIDALLIAILYAIGIYWIGKMPKEISSAATFENPGKSDDHVLSELQSPITLRHAIIGFGIAALVIMAAGTALSITGDQIAGVTGLGSSFVGSFLIAATTSLPEAVTVFMALKLKNVNLAFGSILGSNIFNMLIIAMSDVFYRDGSILADVSSSHLVTSVGITILSIIVMYSILRKQVTKSFKYVLPSLMIVIVYFISSYLIFIG